MNFRLLSFCLMSFATFGTAAYLRAEETAKKPASSQNCQSCHTVMNNKTTEGFVCPASHSYYPTNSVTTFYNFETPASYDSKKQTSEQSISPNWFGKIAFPYTYEPIQWATAPMNVLWGMKLAPVNDDLRSHLHIAGEYGAIVRGVEPNSHASKLGFTERDVLVSIEDQPISYVAVANLLQGVGTKTKSARVIRGGQPLLMKITGPVPVDPNKYWIGTSVSPIDDLLRSHLDIEADVGVVVTNLYDSAAQAAGIAVNDVLVSFAGQKLSGSDDLLKAVQKCGSKAGKMEFYRKGKKMFVEITPQERPKATADAGVNPQNINAFDHTISSIWLRSNPEALNLSQASLAPMWRMRHSTASLGGMAENDITQVKASINALQAELNRLHKIVKAYEEEKTKVKSEPTVPKKQK